MKFFNSKRLKAALILAALLVIYLFNFVTVYINIIASRSLGRQTADYALNILIFTALIYLMIAFVAYFYSMIFGKKNIK